jgi:hypothetical protein
MDLSKFAELVHESYSSDGDVVTENISVIIITITPCTRSQLRENVTGKGRELQKTKRKGNKDSQRPRRQHPQFGYMKLM